MHWRIVTVGKPALSWARQGLDDYLHRLRRVAKVEHVVIKEGPRDHVETQLLQASADSFRIVLDERGKAYRSLDLARWIEQKDLHGTKRASLIIGGADGHSAAFRAQADECWTLSSFTLQHEIALVVLAEQLYRAYSILRNEPYHRE
ncbi:23S rRNA (pseudouridine1915-N3)-methyltransferase [Prosthecobacter debontii]|uniref:Ribosomal RNA large subunit methyltransferase H n=1 Tax=Prosthecobacter debontii TaxID=48467 RepID=A0A1T4WUL7_9BACT|nr:23S rRNA (pseudouridine(1915)-N(3))-methyltransferase RlmH [Prosthecobacter debontii]SKA80321.1 23S rRNA (pseudouridine1915-N3)-methyltransferase [Prosthecobacter debontii]